MKAIDRPSGVHEGRQLTDPLSVSFCRVPSDRRTQIWVDPIADTLTASALPSGESAGYWKSAFQPESTGSARPSRDTQTSSDECAAAR